MGEEDDSSSSATIALTFIGFLFLLALCAPLCIWTARHRKLIHAKCCGGQQQQELPLSVASNQRREPRREKTKRPRDYINSDSITQSSFAKQQSRKRQRRHEQEKPTKHTVRRIMPSTVEPLPRQAVSEATLATEECTLQPFTRGSRGKRRSRDWELQDA